MELKKNSITTKLYLWFYNKTANDLPESLCPYFWQLVIMWIFIMPIAILQIPYFIFSKIKFVDKNIIIGDETHSDRFIIGLLLLILTLCLLSFPILPIYSIFLLIKEGFNKDNLFQQVGLGYIATFVIIAIAFIIQQIVLYYIIERIKKEPQQNIIKEFLKAKYNKYCPRITWK